MPPSVRDTGAHPYVGARFALLTQHAKESSIAPVINKAFAGASLEVVRSFDTDTLGTFTRDVPRPGSQIAAARRKAELACELGGVGLGLGSEGAFLPGPFGFGLLDFELVVLVDRALGIEIVGRAEASAPALHATVSDASGLEAFALRAGFPAHGLVLRPDRDDDPRIHKDLMTFDALGDAFAVLLSVFATGRVFVEQDLRAHRNPARMGFIRSATQDLVRRARELCPACLHPGYGHVAVIPGLRCRDCRTPTRVPLADELGCVCCVHRQRRTRSAVTFADPAYCDFGNP